MLTDRQRTNQLLANPVCLPKTSTDLVKVLMWVHLDLFLTYLGELVRVRVCITPQRDISSGRGLSCYLPVTAV